MTLEDRIRELLKDDDEPIFGKLGNRNIVSSK